MEHKLSSIDDINKYYKNLYIEPYWLEESLGFNIIKEITLIFHDLHNLYPDVVIKEIGDCYSYDKITNQVCINNLNKAIEDVDLLDVYGSDESSKIKTREFLIGELSEYRNKIITKEFDQNGNKYYDLGYCAIYYAKEQKIIFNQASLEDYRENIVHEFGHAVAYQYDLNKNEKIQEIYENLKNYEVILNVSIYANKNIYEFIAEVFTQHYYYNRRNDIIQKVMDVIQEKAKASKAMGYHLIEFYRKLKR
ncbi:hypothetical protein HBE96_17240 [Clostridium sp. P21]|uniref:Uncharacterized protein n=1 Tax=Clostridium muellerianum TaxID=2716538 RepID=A0A7Y0HQ45_9CLOT|nr:hypothetical protein [Clostridium muellerianum]NMM64367.1 hypothetical protein [Clostridium muellerianum]